MQETIIWEVAIWSRSQKLQQSLEVPVEAILINDKSCECKVAYLIDLQPFGNTSSMVLMLTGQCSQLIAVLVSHTAYDTSVCLNINRRGYLYSLLLKIWIDMSIYSIHRK